MSIVMQEWGGEEPTTPLERAFKLWTTQSEHTGVLDFRGPSNPRLLASKLTQIDKKNEQVNVARDAETLDYLLD